MSGVINSIVNLVLRIYTWFICWEILLDFQRGVVLRFGQYHRMAHPGWNWRLPFGIEGILACNVVPTTTDLPPQAVVTADGQAILVEAVIMWGISSPRKFLLEVEDTISVLSEAGAAKVYDIVSQMTWDDLMDNDPDEVLTTEVKERAQKWGVKIYSVQIVSLSRLGLKYGSLRLSNPAQMVQ